MSTVFWGMCSCMNWCNFYKTLPPNELKHISGGLELPGWCVVPFSTWKPPRHFGHCFLLGLPVSRFAKPASLVAFFSFLLLLPCSCGMESSLSHPCGRVPVSACEPPPSVKMWFLALSMVVSRKRPEMGLPSGAAITFCRAQI